MRCAVVVSQHKSLRQAAERLNIRQSTLSRRLRDLEYRLGVELFERTTGGTRPTAVGEEFLKVARHIIIETDSSFARLLAYCRGESGGLSIGVYMAFSAGNMRATLLEFHHRFPDVELRVADGSCLGLLSDVTTNDLDIAILTETCPSWGGRTLPLWHERVVVALPEEHPLCAEGAIQWSDLRKEPVVINRRDPGPEFYRLLIAKLGHRELGRTTEFDVGIDRLLSLVGAGFGFTLVLEGATGARYPGVVFREIYHDNEPARLGFVACWREANSNPALKPFLALLQERYPDLSVPERIIEA